MSTHHALASSSPPQFAKTEVPTIARRLANYHPSIWGDHFISYASNSLVESADDKNSEKTQETLKEFVRSLIVSPIANLSAKMDFIDVVDRLGVAYHFKDEIEIVLRKIYEKSGFDCNDKNEEGHEDLYTIALKFRLLRQQGYNVPCDVFKKFTDNEGKLKQSIASDVRGMLSLYEASYFRVHGENILEEALTLTTYHLKSMVSKNLIECPILAEKVTRALKKPYRNSLPRIEARFFISAYENDPSHVSDLLKFAKVDFDILQKMHQKELGHIARWWKELDVARKLPFARDRIIECYFWIMGVYFEPQYSFARRSTTKVIAVTSIIDDIYDAYGTIEELELFTAAAQRWDISAMDQLPDYMKLCYKILLDIYVEIGEGLKLRNGDSELYRLDYVKENMKTLIRDYMKEAVWCNAKYVPTVEEYMSVGLSTTGYKMLATTSFVGMDGCVTRSSFEWLQSNPKLITASEIICRLMDDIVSHKDEQERGHVASAIECYVKQFGGTEEEAVNKFQEQVTNAFKDINEEWLNPNTVPLALKMRIINLARVIDLLYTEVDYYTNPSEMLKKLITYVLIDPVPL